MNKVENRDQKKQSLTANKQRKKEEWNSSSGRILHNFLILKKNSLLTKKRPFGRGPNNCLYEC